MAQSRKSIKKDDKSSITSVGREGVNLAMPHPQQEHTSKREKQLLIVTHNNTIPTKIPCDRHLVNTYIQCAIPVLHYSRSMANPLTWANACTATHCNTTHLVQVDDQ